MFVALAVSIAFHEIVAGLIPAPPQVAQARRERIATVRIARIVVARTPTPPPPPPARPIVSHARVLAPLQPRHIVHTTNAKSAPRQAVVRAGAARPKPPVVTQSRPVWDVPTGAQGAGAGAAAGAGSLGNGGNGTGAGTQGTGNGAAEGNEPCGFVEFSDPHGSHYDPGTHGFWVDIRMNVHYGDGRVDSLILDYPFYYPNEAANPWSTQNLNNPNVPTTFQTPPPDKRAGEPALVQYVIEHSNAQGFTMLKDCPGTASNPPRS